MADPSILSNLAKFKELAKESLQQKYLVNIDHSEELFTMALALSAAVKKVFFEKSENKFSSEPVIGRKIIIQFVDRMRVNAMEKFDTTTMLSVVHFYKDTHALEKNDPIGLVLVYIERSYVPEMLRLLKYPYIDYDNEAEVLDGIGTITNLMAGYFKKELARLGYIDLEMSAFKSAVNTVLDGVEYCKEQTHKYEIAFEINEQKRLVVEMIMNYLPKVGEE